ncbi:MAG: ribosomal protein L7/L12 [Planctomycetes bacterium]|nr:ribosomal protein L7/L12 [Planctomycetota bacterium]
MASPFPPAVPPPPPNSGGPAFAQPAGSMPFQPGAFQAPPPAQKSGGCFKGCCIAGVIVGLLGVGGLVFLGLTWKKILMKQLSVAVIDPSDLTPDEKVEARSLLEKYFELATGSKAGDQTFAEGFQKNFNDLGQSANGGKPKASSLRPIFGRIKKVLGDNGHPYPSTLFPFIPDVDKGSSTGNWNVVVSKFDEARRKEVVQAIMRKDKVTEMVADSMLKSSPAIVLNGVSKADAEEFRQALEALGCDAEVAPEKAEATPH